MQVPLDYDDPNGAKIFLAVIRLRAGDAGRRIGSLFVNPGSPGGRASTWSFFAGQFLFPPTVRDRFDIVGLDPRGVARSTQLHCYGTLRQRLSPVTPFPFPITDEEEAAWIAAADREFVESCDHRGGRMAAHMSTPIWPATWTSCVRPSATNS